MPDFQILKITLQSAAGEQVYIRREIIGSPDFGGNQNPPYPKNLIIDLHAGILKRVGNKASRFDKAAANATEISVEVLRTEGLKDVTENDADKAKEDEIRKFKETNQNWKEQLLNGKFVKDK